MMKPNQSNQASGMLDDTSENRNTRFSSLLDGSADVLSSAPSETVLYRDKDLIVAPTLGSFLPYWYLVLPTERHLSFSDWAHRRGERSVSHEISRIANSVLQCDDFLWFEHGPSKSGSITGCGVDHAHIHILLSSGVSCTDMLGAAAALGVTGWKKADLATVYSNREGNSEYLAFGDANTGFFMNLSNPVGSQFFRRALAALKGNRRDWDYKLFAHQQNAKLSVERLDLAVDSFPS